MSRELVQLRTAVATAISAALEISIEEVHIPHFDANDVQEETWIAAVGSDELSANRRTIAENELAIDIALQHAHPKRAQRDDPEFDTNWIDGRINRLGDVKDLFKPGGALRDQVLIGSAEFQRYENSPVFVDDLLFENRIFTGVVRLIYTHESNSE